MLLLSWSTFRDRWQLFAGAIITVCLGVAMVHASLLTLVAAADAAVPPGLPEAEARAIRDGYDAAASLSGMMLFLSAFIAVFIVSSTFAFTVAQRRRDLALLRLTGARRGQLRLLLLGEALLLGGVGAALGILLGVPVLRLLVRVLDGFGFLPPGFAAPWRSWVVAVSVGAGVGIAVLGVLAASRRAARVRPLEALRETGRAARVMTVSRWLIGGVFLAGGCLMLVLVPAVGGEGALGMSILVSMVLVIAFAALAPLVVPAVGWVLGRFSRGHLGQLAHANLRAGVRRSASTAAPVMVLVAFVAGLAGTLDLIGTAGEREMTRRLQADLLVTTERPVAAEVAAVAGVRTVSEQVPVLLDIEVDDGFGETYLDSYEALAVDPGPYTDLNRVAVSAGNLADLRGAAVALDPSFFPDQSWRVGETVRVRLGGEPAELRIAAVLSATLTGPAFLLPRDLAPEQPGPRQYLIGLDEGAEVSAVSGRLSELGEVATAAEWIQRTASEEQRTSVKVLVALLGMAALYTIVAMVNAVVIAASDRREEFATARVTGLTRGQVVRMALRESLAVVAIGLLLGGLAAAATIAGVAGSIRDITGLTVLVLPWPLLAALVLGAITIVGVATVWTTLAATRTPPVRLVAARE